MSISGAEGREQIVDDLGAAISYLSLTTACLGEAYELLAVDAADRMESTLFMPTQRALGRCKRTQKTFAEQNGLDVTEPKPGSTGPPSQGVGVFIEKAAEASSLADMRLGELQDSMLPIEYGDPELRAAIAEVRESLDGVPTAAREFMRTLGR